MADDFGFVPGTPTPAPTGDFGFIPKSAATAENYIGAPSQVGGVQQPGIVKNYMDAVTGGEAEMRAGVQDIGKGNYLRGAGKTAMGALGFVAAPINAPIKTYVSDPIANLTGSPMAGDVAGMLVPLGGFRASGLAAKAVAGAEKVAQESKAVQFGKKVLAPETISPAAAGVAQTIERSRGTRRQAGDRAIADLENFRPVVNKMSPEEQKNILRAVEGTTTVPAEHRPLVEALKKIYGGYRQVLESHPMTEGMGLVEKYVPHWWKQPDVAADIFKEGFAKQGSAKNLRARKYMTLDEGEKAGLKLETTDPIHTAINYAKNMDSYLSHADTFHSLKERGLIGYMGAKAAKAKEWVPLEGRYSTSKFTGLDKEGEAVHSERQAYAPEDVAAVFNRSISKTPGGIPGKILRGAKNVSGALTGAKLMFGVMYHTRAIGKMAVANTVKSMGAPLSRGDFAGAKAAASEGMKTIFGKGGQEYFDGYLGKKTLSPGKQENLDAMVAADAVRIGAADYIITGKGRSLFSAVVRKGKGIEASLPEAIKGDLKQLYKDKNVMSNIEDTIRYIGNTAATPVFDYWIPRVKTGALGEHLDDFKKSNPGYTKEDLDAAAREGSAMLDRHMGEMNRDKIYWSSLTKEIAQLGFLSYSWVLGTIVGTAKGASSVARTTLRGDPLSAEGKMLVATLLTDAAMSSVYQYMKTGKPAQVPKDLIFPQTGGRKYGAPERLSSPGHEQQVYMYLTNPVRELGNEVSPMVQMLWKQARGQDYAGDPQDRLKLLMEAMVPIPGQSMSGREAGTGIGKFGTLMGDRPANMDITNPDLVKKIEAGKEKKAAFKERARKSRLEKAGITEEPKE